MAQFKDIFIQLIKNMIELIKFPSHVFQLLNEKKTKYLKQDDDYNNIKDYRENLNSFLSDFTRIYSFNFVYNNIIYPEFLNTVQNIKENSNNLNHWSKFEAILYTFSCISELVTPQEMNSLNVLI